VSIEATRVVDSVGLDHTPSKDDDGSHDDEPGQEGRDDHADSRSTDRGSVLSSSIVNQVDKDEPRDPGNDHEDQDGGVDPLKGRVVLVDGVARDARSVDETVGSVKETSVSSDGRIVVVEGIVVTVDGVVLGVPPGSDHGADQEDGGNVSQDQSGKSEE